MSAARDPLSAQEARSGPTAQRVPQPFRVERTQTRDSAWVHLYGELDMSTAPVAEAAIASAATLGKPVTIDLRGLDFIDSTGISLLFRFDRAADHPPTVVAPAGPVTRLLQMCGLHRQMTLMDEPDT